MDEDNNSSFGGCSRLVSLLYKILAAISFIERIESQPDPLCFKASEWVHSLLWGSFIVFCNEL